MLSFIILTARNTVIAGGFIRYKEFSDAVEYFGPLNITIPPLPFKVYGTGAVYIDGTIYNCGGYNVNLDISTACYKYNLAANSGSWEKFTDVSGISIPQPVVAYDDFFWYFTRIITQVPVNGSSVSTFDWSFGRGGCAVANGSHTVLIQSNNTTVLMNANPRTPTSWTTFATLNFAFEGSACLWLGNTIYVTGGTGEDPIYPNVTQLINTATFEVTLGAELPVGVVSHRMGVIDGNPAVFGGSSNGDTFSTIYVYNNCTWSLSDLSLPQGLSSFGSVTF